MTPKLYGGSQNPIINPFAFAGTMQQAREAAAREFNRPEFVSGDDAPELKAITEDELAKIRNQNAAAAPAPPGAPGAAPAAAPTAAPAAAAPQSDPIPAAS